MKPATIRQIRRWTLFGIALLIGFLFLISFQSFFAWSPINCWHEDVDIRTGKTRYSRYILYRNTKTEIKDSALSSALFPQERNGIEPDWRRVNTFSPGIHHSPHYVFHGALNQIRMMETVFEMHNFTPGQKRKLAQDILTLWQHEDGDYLVGQYLNSFPSPDEMSETERKIFLQKFENIKICEQKKIGDLTEFTARYPDGMLLDRYQARVTEDGKRIHSGRHVIWRKNKQAGEEAVFENGELKEQWHSITNYPE